MKLIFTMAMASFFCLCIQANASTSCSVFVQEANASDMDYWGQICFSQNYGTVNFVTIVFPGQEKKSYQVVTGSTVNTQKAFEMSMAQWKTTLLLKQVGHNIPEQDAEHLIVEILGDGQDKFAESNWSAYYDAEIKIGYISYIMWGSPGWGE